MATSFVILLLILQTVYGCNLDILAPRQGFRIANALVDVVVGVRCDENRTLSICISFDENKPGCGMHKIYEKVEYKIEATLNNVHVGDHVLRSWISEDESSFREIEFRSVLVERPWWKSFEVKQRDTEKNSDKSYIYDVDAELLPHLLGPRTRSNSMEIASLPRRSNDIFENAKTLVAIFVGKKSIGTVSSNIKRLGFEKFSFIVFNYDGSDLSDQEWFDRVIVVIAVRQMKWWYVITHDTLATNRILSLSLKLCSPESRKKRSQIQLLNMTNTKLKLEHRYIKRFVTISMMASYDYLFVIDGDCDMSSLNGTAFVRDLSRHDVKIGQPAHSEGSFQPQYPFLVHNHEKNGNAVGMWSNFIESGPLVAFSRDIWQCVWNLLQPDLTSGYGYDLVWVPACANGRGAVLYEHEIHHMNEKSASRRPNFVGRAAGEAHEFFQRISRAGLGPVTPNTEGTCF